MARRPTDSGAGVGRPEKLDFPAAPTCECNWTEIILPPERGPCKHRLDGAVGKWI